MKIISKFILSTFLLSSNFQAQAYPDITIEPIVFGQQALQLYTDNKIAVGMITGACVTAISFLKLRNMIADAKFLTKQINKRPESMWPISIRNSKLPQEINLRDQEIIKQFNIIIEEYKIGETTKYEIFIEAPTFEKFRKKVRNYLESCHNKKLYRLIIKPTLQVAFKTKGLKWLFQSEIPFKPFECNFEQSWFFTQSKQNLLNQVEKQIVKSFMKKNEICHFAHGGKLVSIIT